VDIAQRIRQQAQERGVDPELAVSIAQAESGLKPGAKNPSSSARGLFQVTNDTWKQYGGDPKKRMDVSENIRVGLDIIADNTAALSSTLGREPRPAEVYAAHFFGKAGARRVLAADPNAPISEVVSPAVMKANQSLLEGKTVAQAVNALGRKVGDEVQAQDFVGYVPSTGAGGPSPAVDRPVGRGYREDPANPPVISRAIEATRDLGPGYQAALALSYLADTEESSDAPDSPSIVEREAQEEMAQQAAAPRRSNAAQMLANMDFGYTPVVGQQQPQQEPVRMAEGGSVLSRFKQALGGARTAARRLRGDLEATAQRAAANYRETPRPMGTVPAPTPVSPTTFSRIPFSRGTVVVDNTAAANLRRMLGQGALMEREAAAGISPQEVVTRGRPAVMAQVHNTEAQRRLAELLPNIEVATPSLSGVSMPQFAAPQFATAATWQQALGNPFLGQRMGTPVRMADGGEVTDPYAQMMQGAPRERVSPGQFLRGGLDTAAGMLKGATQAAVGMPGDIESLIRMGVGSKRDTVLPTTDDVKRTIDRFAPLNLPADEGTGGRTAAEYFGEFMSPAAATRPVVRGAQALGEGVMEGARQAERALEEPVRRTMERGGRAAELLQSFSTTPSYAVRPPGGNVFPEQVNEIVSGYDVQRALDGIPTNRREDVRQFLETKGRKYFQKDYASTKDPLYEALREGRILPLKETADFRGYLMRAAREGDPHALEDLARNYDRAVDPVVVSRPPPPGGGRLEERAQEDEVLARLIRNLQEAPGGALPVERQIPHRYTLFRSQENVEGYPLNRPLTPDELKAVERGDPFYSLSSPYSIPSFMRPETIAGELADIPADRLKNMSYPEAVMAVNQPARFRADWSAAVRRAGEGKDVPKDVKMFGVAPEPLVKADKGAWHQLRDPQSTEMEGAIMGHSVGGYSRVGSYGHGGLEAFQSGRAKVYSLRDSKGDPRVTVEVLDTPEGIEVTQIKGRYNAGPREAEVNDVMKLLEQLDTGGRLRNIRTESYLTKDNAPKDAITGMTEWKRLYNEYLLGKQ
jgi:hypothetical protein